MRRDQPLARRVTSVLKVAYKEVAGSCTARRAFRISLLRRNLRVLRCSSIQLRGALAAALRRMAPGACARLPLTVETSLTEHRYWQTTRIDGRSAPLGLHGAKLRACGVAMLLKPSNINGGEPSVHWVAVVRQNSSGVRSRQSAPYLYSTASPMWWLGI
jgi:hypothetical protein